MAIRIDVVVVVIDRVHENTVFMHFVGMLVGSCFKVDEELVRAAFSTPIAGL